MLSNMRDLFAELTSAAHNGATGLNGYAQPTVGQLKAGTYLKGRITVQGMPIAIETPQGQRRQGKSDGQPWSVICMAHYGDLSGTKGADGDPVDVFVGPVPESEKVWVVNQSNKDGGFDEHKVLLGFADEESARTAYMNSYERGWKGLQSLIPCTITQFKWWLKFGDTTKPLTLAALPHDGENEEMTEKTFDATLAETMYGLRRDDADGLMFDSVTVTEILEDSDGEVALDALVVPFAKMDRKMDQLNKVMEAAGGEVKPVAVQVTPPFKQRGTTNVAAVFELSDGQSITVFFHNPDSTPNKLLPGDEMVSWKWLLNKKDVTIAVAPEKGQDLNVREVARRVMRLAERNSARFTKANATRAGRMTSIANLKSAVSDGEATLAGLDAKVADLSQQVEAKRSAPAADLQADHQADNSPIETPPVASATVIDPTSPDGYEAVMADESLQLAHQDQLDSFFQGRIIAIRNALRDLGWDGDRFKSLSKAGFTLKQVLKQVGAGANIVGANYEIEGVPGFFMSDSLTRTPEEMAAAINMGIPAEAPQAQSLADLARSLIPVEFENKEDTDGITFMAPDGFGIRLRRGPTGNILGYVLDAKGQDSLGARGTDPIQVKDLIDTALRVIEEKRSAGVAEAAVLPEVGEASGEPAGQEDAGDGGASAKTFLQDVIDGNVDYSAPDLASRLEVVNTEFAGDAEVMDLFGKAADAFSAYWVEQARKALA